MLKKQTGILQVQKLYLQMLFRCNFDCEHCFQGVKLQQDDHFTLPEAKSAISLFCREYGLKSVTLLGGEPFLHPNLSDVLSFCKELNLETVICTNGYRISKMLSKIASNLDHLRVSIDGLRQTHDEIRREGSFDAALETLAFARQLKIPTSVTTTITKKSVGQLYELARTVESYGVTGLKLHQLRLIGNAEKHPELLCEGRDLEILHNEIERVQEDLKISILLDDDLDPKKSLVTDEVEVDTYELERIEIQPDGAMYVSCKAVGNNSNAFWLKKDVGEIDYRPTLTDEVTTHSPQVRYARLENGR